MNSAEIQFQETRDLSLEKVLSLYNSVGWSSAEKPEALYKGLLNSHSLVTAWCGDQLIGLANTLSDGHLVVYYSHVLVHPEFQGRGIATRLMQLLMAHYQGFHQHVVIADGRAIDFFRKCGFTRAGNTESMWIYAGSDH